VNVYFHYRESNSLKQIFVYKKYICYVPYSNKFLNNHK